MNKYKYVVWVGGCDDYYTEYERAKEHYNEWIEQGYDDVHLLKLKENKDDDWIYKTRKHTFSSTRIAK